MTEPISAPICPHYSPGIRERNREGEKKQQREHTLTECACPRLQLKITPPFCPPPVAPPASRTRSLPRPAMLDESRTPAPGAAGLSLPSASPSPAANAAAPGVLLGATTLTQPPSPLPSWGRFGAPRDPDPPRVLQHHGWGADPARRLPGAAPKCLKHWRQEELQLPANSCPVLLW